MIQLLKRFYFPKIDLETKKNIDSESVNSIFYISFIAAVVEAITLLLVVITEKQFNRQLLISLGSMLFCLITCLTGNIIAYRMRKNAALNHKSVTLFKIVYFVVLSVWSIWVSYRQYSRGEQLLTFFAVELIIVCFIPFRPWVGTALMVGVYGVLYATLYSIDAAKGINTVNYVVLACISIAGIIVRCQSQIRTAEKTVLLQKNNEALEFMARHDVLTKLRNRKALDEDAAGLVGSPVSASMIDIDYFKEINDTYGHTVGDDVLKETARQIEALYPGSLCYRYGGDEFLVLNTLANTYDGEAYSFTASSVPRRKILLSIGFAEGVPQDGGQLFDLIAAADARLYEVKRKTHSPEFGGHDRRRRP